MSASSVQSPHAPSADGVFRRGFGLKSEITGDLQADYHSEIVEKMRVEGFRLAVGGVEIRLAKEFGFCYGVDKAVDFAYETRRRFPDRRIFITAEIIHNPRVNNRLIELGIQFLSGPHACGLAPGDIQPEDVVILPAFGVSLQELERFRQRGCVIVDTTCGSVVHVWKRVEKYAKENFTSLIHGKYKHEETIATASHAAGEGGQGAYIVVFDKAEAQAVCDFIQGGLADQEGRSGLRPDVGSESRPTHAQSAAGMAERFKGRVSEGFDFNRDLVRVGVANQTTMLSSESLEIAGMVREAMIERFGASAVEEHFRSFDTICSATQERQDAVMEMMRTPPDVMIVIGGYNSSNTHHLCEIASQYCPTYHIDDADGMISAEAIRHKPLDPQAEPRVTEGWLPARRPLSIGLTAGASTPNKVIGEIVERLVAWTGTVSSGIHPQARRDG